MSGPPRAPSFNPLNLPASFLPPSQPGPPSRASFDEHVAAAHCYARRLAETVLPHLHLLDAGPDRVQFLATLSCLPPGWEEELRAIPPGCAQELLRPSPLQGPQPAEGSLSALFRSCSELASPRGCRTPHVSLPLPERWPVPRLETLFTNQKKAHELEVFTALIASTAAASGCCCVVDGGAGAGRLGAVLSAAYHLRCTGLERDSAQVEKAAARRAWADADAARRVRPPPARPVAVVVEQELSAHSISLLEDDGPALLTGLHACGELTSTLLREFAGSSHLRALVVAGCCYQHNDDDTFPMSAALAQPGALPASFALTRRAREAAAQSASPEYLARVPLRTRTAMLTKAVGRAVLAEMLAEVGRTPLPNQAYDVKRPFWVHLEAALGGEAPLSLAAREEAERRFRAAQERGDGALLGGFTALRSGLGGLVESLIVLDRALFLAEVLEKELAPGCVPCLELLPLFDAALSPKNLVLWAMRPLGV